MHKPLRVHATEMTKQKKRVSQTSNFSDRWCTLLLAMLAAIGVHLLRLHASHSPLWLNLEFTSVLFACSVAWLRASSRWNPSVRMGVGAFCVGLPMIQSMVQTRLLGTAGEPTELVWIGMLQYAALWQAASALSARQEWISFLLSSFLMVFGLATSDRGSMFVIVILFGLMAAWWMMAKYWQSIARGFIEERSVPLIRLRIGALLAAIALTSVIGILAMSSGANLTALDGFMPTSGGNGQSDPSARNGIGDGDMLVAAKEQAYTFGPVESDLFLDSKTPSLYDLISDFYGEPYVKKDVLRTISLDSNIQESKDEGSESKKKSREFSAVRRPGENAKGPKPKGTDSRAVFHLIGRVPQHLRLESFDSFDGSAWFQSEEVNWKPNARPVSLDTMNGRPWMKLQSYPRELSYPVRERQTIKVIGLKSPRIVSPSLLTHTYIDKVDQPDFFGWAEDGQLMMPNRDHVPQLSVVHQMYQTPQLHPLRVADDPLSRLASLRVEGDTIPLGFPKYSQLNPEQADYLTEFIDHCVDKQLNGTSKGLTDWQKVESIVSHLRSEFKHMPSSTAPEGCSDVVKYFLDSKVGPDYLFATTAATMVRALRIPSRVVTGFYASPEHYDFKSGQTEVLPEHLHTWAEVYCHGIWLPIEPTPGFAIPLEHRTWVHWAIESWWLARDSFYYHPTRYALCLTTALLILALRHRLADAVLSSICLVAGLTPLRVQVCWTNRLLQWRSWLYGQCYPLRCTVKQRLESQIQKHCELSVVNRIAYIHAAERIAYAPKRRTAEWLDANAILVRQACWCIATSGCRNLFKAPIHNFRSSKNSYQ